MRKKIIVACLSLALVATVAIGGTLAYFTDKDQVTNVFTVGKVDIELRENFEQDSLLMPGSQKSGTVKKEVFVDCSEDSQPTYVRVHIAIPHILDEGDPSFDAKNNVLHFNFPNSEGYKDAWSWNDPATGKPYYYYETEIEGKLYNVYVVTYLKELAPGTTTEYPAMNQVYLDKRVTSEDAAKINEALGKWNILVVAEGTQAANFTDAFTALETSFGHASAESNPFLK